MQPSRHGHKLTIKINREDDDVARDATQKPKYSIEVRDVSQSNLLAPPELPEFEKSNSELNSARQIKEDASKDGFDKSPRHSEENAGKHFLNVPHLQARSIHISDKGPLLPKVKLTDVYESGSIKEPMITTGQHHKLYHSEDENASNVKMIGSDDPVMKKNGSKKEMMSSKASRSNSQEFNESQKLRQNYRINLEKVAGDRRRSYEVDVLQEAEVDVVDLRMSYRSLNRLSSPSPQRETHMSARLLEAEKSFDD